MWTSEHISSVKYYDISYQHQYWDFSVPPNRIMRVQVQAITPIQYPRFPEGREILELREWRRSWPLGMDFPMVNPAFKFSLILFLFALGIEVSLLG